MNSSLEQLSLFEQEISHSTNTVSDITDTSNNSSERPDTYTGMYAMHKYWSKKPYNLVAQYIERYSQKGELILDPFCGSGVTITESIKSFRKAIGIDINPIATFLTSMGLEHINTRSLKNHFEFLRDEVEHEIDKQYFTKCSTCSNEQAIITHTIWEGEIPKEIWVECRNCKKRKTITKPSDTDICLALKKDKPVAWYPTVPLIENGRVNAKAGTLVSDLFTSRALYGLSLLLEKIQKIKDTKIRAVLEFCFTAALPQASKMVFVIRRRGKANGQTEVGKAEVGSWVIGYWIPPEHFEIHSWRCFENRFRRILKGKTEVNFAISPQAVSCSSFEELLSVQLGYWIHKGNATDIPILSESIDYIFTDPPHGNRIPYLELSLMWNSWLGKESDWENEIIVSEAKNRKKDATDYQERLKAAFAQAWRVLKPNKYISVAFNSLDDEAWLSLLSTLLELGFYVCEIAPLEYSARSVVQDTRKNALKTDFVITCQKQIPQTKRSISVNKSVSQISNSIGSYLSNRKQGAATYEVINRLLIDSISKGYVFNVSQIVETLEKDYIFDKGHWYSQTS
ncbi:MAG: DNA methyltransferase [Caldilineaceae bacterium]